MSLDTILVYIHVIGAIGYFAGTIMSVFGLLALRRAERVEETRSILGLIALSDPVAAISLLITIAVGLYMTITRWGWQNAWINVSLGSLVLLMPVATVVGTRRRAIAKLAKEMPDGPLPESLEQHIYDPLLGTALVVQLALLLGITFLMIAEPALNGSMIVIALAVALGLVLSLPIWRNTQRVGGSSNAA
jgi:uncharacterized membrane protein